LGKGGDFAEGASLAPGPLAPEVVGAFVSDAGEHFDEAFESDFVAPVGDELHEGGGVFDVGLLEEAQSARDDKGDAAVGQFELNLHGVEMGAIKNGDLVEFDSLVPQFEDALGNKSGLGTRILQLGEGG